MQRFCYVTILMLYNKKVFQIAHPNLPDGTYHDGQKEDACSHLSVQFWSSCNTIHAASGHSGSVALASPLKRTERNLKAFDSFNKGFEVRVIFCLESLRASPREAWGLNSAWHGFSILCYSKALLSFMQKLKV